MEAWGVFGFRSFVTVCDSSQHIVGTLLDYLANDLERAMEKHATLAPGKTQSFRTWGHGNIGPRGLCAISSEVHSYPRFSG